MRRGTAHATWRVAHDVAAEREAPRLQRALALAAEHGEGRLRAEQRDGRGAGVGGERLRRGDGFAAFFQQEQCDEVHGV